ncbi:hypothetical protein LOK49_LG15G01811 [Camellia lanceoleosa]|uniref:Uncharacterized protein n=1 Tax=Camellia lanceoleosa TaxID=1840588 RepID=A0ACC0F677_9ERIC|nr:hypothetical protein LOK49_LG15G01811 [Camellia lanceoleosa]
MHWWSSAKAESTFKAQNICPVGPPSNTKGTILDLIKKQIDRVGSEKSSLMLKCRSIEDKMGLLNKQLEASEKYKSKYFKRYEDAINDKKKLADDYMSWITNL